MFDFPPRDVPLSQDLLIVLYTVALARDSCGVKRAPGSAFIILGQCLALLPFVFSNVDFGFG